MIRRAVLVLLAATAALAQAAQFSALGFTAPVPSAWRAQPPASNFRLAQYRVPGDAECVVFYFGKGQGGSVAANIQRWRSQFTSADGRGVTPKTQALTVNGLPVTLVELTGSYARGVGTGPQGESKPDQTLRVAVIETTQGNVTIQLYGPRAAVAAQRAAFDAMVRGFRGR